MLPTFAANGFLPLGRYDSYADALAGLPLIHRMWLGGSFVSTKPDPRNIDATLLIDTRAERAVRGKPGSKWLTTAFQSRDRMREKFGVSPLRIGYQPNRAPSRRADIWRCDCERRQLARAQARAPG
ncbi:DUF6932 family protein [Streptomyces sp. NPDC002671]